MGNPKEDMINVAASSGILGALTAAVRALIVKGESPMERIRTFFAGVFISIFLGILMNETALSPFYKYLFVGSGGAFVSTVWPILERIAKKYVTKKGNDVVSGSNSD